MNDSNKYLIFMFAAMILCVSTFSAAAQNNVEKPQYINITAAEAKDIMDSGADCVILDVRTPAEFQTGHIAGAILIPYDAIQQNAPALLPDKSCTILVYCRSGRRSKIAAQTLFNMGYRDISEFGGIIDWPYSVETN